MFRTRPPGYAIACISLCLIQLGSTVVVLRDFWSVSDVTQKVWGLSAVSASLALGVLVLLQLPRALQWRPRLNPRPSSEVLAERQRIARDLHDGVGSQLVCAMALLNANPASDANVTHLLEKSMLDLRLLVDSMDGASEPFFDRLAKLRHRMHPALERRGIGLVWNVQVASSTKPLDSDTATHMLGILQEALSNVLQHSRATEVSVQVQYICASGSWYAEVCDNGMGITASDVEGAVHAGHGVAGMRRRANLAGGQLNIERRREGGTCLSALVPGHPIAQVTEQ